MAQDGVVELDLVMLEQKGLAYKFDTGSKTIYLPISQCNWVGKNKWEVPLWLAKKEGLI